MHMPLHDLFSSKVLSLLLRAVLMNAIDKGVTIIGQGDYGDEIAVTRDPWSLIAEWHVNAPSSLASRVNDG